MFNLDSSSNASFNLSLRSPDVSASISLWFLYTFGFLLKIPFFATKNLPSDGSIPANTAGAPSHLTVTLVFFLALPASISRIDCSALIACLAPLTPPSRTKSSMWVMCVFFSSLRYDVNLIIL